MAPLSRKCQFQKGLITLKSINSRSIYFKTLEVESDSVSEDDNEQQTRTYAAASKTIGECNKSSDRLPH